MSLHPETKRFSDDQSDARSTARPCSPSLKRRLSGNYSLTSRTVDSVTSLPLATPERPNRSRSHSIRRTPSLQDYPDDDIPLYPPSTAGSSGPMDDDDDDDDDRRVLTSFDKRRLSDKRQHHVRSASAVIQSARRRVVSSLSFAENPGLQLPSRRHSHIRLPDTESFPSIPDERSSLPPSSSTSLTIPPFVRSFFDKVVRYRYFEHIVIFLILFSAIVFTVDTAYNVFSHPRPEGRGYFFTWRDIALFGIFVLFSFELVARILAQGLFHSYQSMSSSDVPVTHSSLDDPSSRLPHSHEDHENISLQHLEHSSKTVPKFISHLATVHARPLPFIRRSWNRVDLVAVAAFWISFILAISGIESQHSFHMFRALSVLRATRLLTLSKGTLTILQSLKRSMPLLVNVAFFVIFAIVLFSIIGVQSFKGSFRRSCIWIDPEGVNNVTFDSQQCGGFIDPVTRDHMPYISLDPEINAPGLAKGFICPAGQLCLEQNSNPQNGLQNFDNVFASMLQIIVVASVNNWTPIMYSMIDADYFISCLYFIVAVIVLNFWLINLFVAVIVYTFKGILDNTSRSAFSSSAPLPLLPSVPDHSLTSSTSEQQDNDNSAQPRSFSHALHQSNRKHMHSLKVNSSSAWAIFVDLFALTKYFWIALILLDIIIQATRTDASSAEHLRILDYSELAFTLAFDVEIIIRFFIYIYSLSHQQKHAQTDYRSNLPTSAGTTRNAHLLTQNRSRLYFLKNTLAFFKLPFNGADFLFALITTIAQLPPVKNSKAYPWLTFFQVARFYRVILAIPRTKRLLVQIFTSWAGIINMIAFVLLMNYVSALVAAEFLRGTIPQEDSGTDTETSFYQIYNSFLAIYQIMTSENWTDPLYQAASNQSGTFQAIITLVFLAGWFLFSNFIVLQLFVAVISEGFEIDEEQRQKAQLDEFVKRSMLKSSSRNWTSKWNPYRYIKPAPKSLNVGNVPSHLVIFLRKNLVGGTSQSRQLARSEAYATGNSTPHPKKSSPESFGPNETSRTSTIRPGISENSNWFKSNLSRFFSDDNSRTKLTEWNGENQGQVPLQPVGKAKYRISKTLRELGFKSHAHEEEEDNHEYDVDRQLDLLAIATQAEAQYAQDEINERRAQEADFIAAHPGFDTSLFIFTQRNPIRRFCQLFVEPSHGTRIYGRAPKKILKIFFSVLIFLTIIASVVVAGVATPKFRRDYILTGQDVRWSWFFLTESALGFVFFLEFLLKIIADGFLFAPNAYLLSFWNGLDLFVLVTLIVNIVTNLVQGGSASRFTRALKAFRAIRLINLSAHTKTIFYDVIIVGFGHILDASLLAVLYMIPYAIWGLNIFSGLLYSCNDSNVTDKGGCVLEYTTTTQSWSYLAPRTWDNPQVWSFDSFRHSLLILFEIISLEGWIDVMHSVMNITGKNSQPNHDSSQYNAIFFVGYILFGGVVVLTLFLTIIIRNFSSRAGFALLSSEQREWVDLKKLLKRQRPSKRPKIRPTNNFQAWCFDRAVHKNGWWSRMMTALYVTHVAILMTQAYDEPAWVEVVRNYVFLSLTMIYASDIAIRITGLKWNSFRKNFWNLYDVAAVMGTFATTIPILRSTQSQTAIQLQKLFLVSIAFKLVQKNNSLNQLFKTAIAGVPAIGNLFLLWGILFLVWAIFFTEVFGLTRWGTHETWRQNFTSFGQTLVFLTLLSTGEGWNGYMHDYTVEPPWCTPSDDYMFSDCGSSTWALGLFIVWNILSMYLFLNLFTGVVVDNFSYIYRLYGNASFVNRDQMRLFKKAWAEFDRNQTGYIRRSHFVPFFGRLSGIFDVKIYPKEYRIPTLLSLARNPQNVDDSQEQHNVVDGIDLDVLAKILSQIDYSKIQENKKRYNNLYHEALILAEPGRGLSFTNMVLLLAHYKLIDDEKALQLDELLQRKEKKEKVTDLVNLDRIRGLFQTIILRKKFLAHRAAVRAAEANVQAILVDDDVGFNLEDVPQTPKLKEEIKASLSLDLSVIKNSPSPPGSPLAHTPLSGRTLSPTNSAIFESGVGNDSSFFSTHSAGHQSVNITDEQEYVTHLEASVWGDMMREAAEDE